MIPFETLVSQDLGTPVLLAITTEPWAGSSARIERMTHPARILAHRRGLAALAVLMARMRRDVSPVDLSFPHPELSVSHTDSHAIAAAQPGGRGLGVDLERAGRVVPERGMRLFLSAVERDHHSGAEEVTRLRLWTIKEALFKAHPENDGLTLASFAMDDPGAWLGTATGAGERFRYGSWAIEEGWVALALRL